MSLTEILGPGTETSAAKRGHMTDIVASAAGYGNTMLHANPRKSQYPFQNYWDNGSRDVAV